MRAPRIHGLLATLLALLVFAACERGVRVKVKVRTQDSGVVTSTGAPSSSTP